MAITNQERVGKALELLKDGLGPFVEREVQDKIKAGGVHMDTIRRFVDDPHLTDKPIRRASGIRQSAAGRRAHH